jgi:phage-related protein
VERFLNNKLNALFYRTKVGNEPVREWLKGLSKEDKKTLGEDIKTVQFGWPLGMPLIRNLSNGLWEIRSKLKMGRIARIVFFMNENTMIIVHGFIKKTQKTPNEDIKLALSRKKETEKGVWL